MARLETVREEGRGVTLGGVPSRAVTAQRPVLDRSDARLNNGDASPLPLPAMPTDLSQAQVLIALVVAAHAGVLAVRLSASLYRA